MTNAISQFHHLGDARPLPDGRGSVRRSKHTCDFRAATIGSARHERGLFFFLIAAAAILPGCRTAETKPMTPAGPAAVRAKVVKLEAQPFAATVAITGTLVSMSRVDVKAETIGRVLKFPKEEGDRVAEGEPIIWVDGTNHGLAVAQAEAAVKVAEASVERARVFEKHGSAELERARNLVKSGGITDKDLKAAELGEQDSRAQTKLSVAQLDQARAALETARKRLQDTVIRAPIGGAIYKKHTNVGAYVEAPTLVFSLVDNTRLEIESLVAAAEVGTIRAGQRVTFTVNSYPGERFEGSVVEVNPAMDAEARSAKVRVRVTNPGGKLRAGMFAQGEILIGVERQAMVVPAAAVYRDDRSAKGAFVFVAENNHAAKRAVRVGRERDSSLEITDGLHPGDLLIAEQSIELAEGVPVQAR